MTISNQELEEFEESGFLTTHMVIDAIVERNREREGTSVLSCYEAIDQIFDKIHAAIEEFNVEIWLLWLYPN